MWYCWIQTLASVSGDMKLSPFYGKEDYVRFRDMKFRIYRWLRAGKAEWKL